MRTVGFTDLDGKLVVSALPPQHPGGRAGGIVSALPPQHPGGAAGGSSSLTANKRQFSSRLASSLRATRLVSGGGGSGAGKDSAAVAAEGAGGAENVPPSGRTSSRAAARSLGSKSGLSVGSIGGCSLDIVEAATAAAAAAATTQVPATPTARPPLGRRNFSRPTFSSSSRPWRTVHSNIDSSSGGVKEQHHPHVLGRISARWVAAGRARRRNSRGGARSAVIRGGLRSSPSTPAPPMMTGPGESRSAPFAAASERRAFSLR